MFKLSTPISTPFDIDGEILDTDGESLEDRVEPYRATLAEFALYRPKLTLLIFPLASSRDNAAL